MYFNFKIKKTNNEKGFALLFSVLLSSLLLTIGLSIFNITLKELAISTAARQSIHAFYAADSGRECALYHDTRTGLVPSLVDGRTGATTIFCGQDDNIAVVPDHEINLANDLNVNSSIGSQSQTVFVSDLNGSNFYVVIEKTRTDTLMNTGITTIITSRGYDSTSDDRVERAIQQTY